MFKKILITQFPMRVTFAFSTSLISPKMLLGGKDLVELIDSIELKIYRGEKQMCKNLEDVKIVLQIFAPTKKNRKGIFLSHVNTQFFVPKERKIYYVTKSPNKQEVYACASFKEGNLMEISFLPSEVEKLKNLFFELLAEDKIFVEEHESKKKAKIA